jgi:hypothetical protein
MKKACILATSLMAFLIVTFGLFDGRMISYSYAYDVTLTNKATMATCIEPYYRCIPFFQECELGGG